MLGANKVMLLFLKCFNNYHKFFVWYPVVNFWSTEFFRKEYNRV
jgi:hypothetical protein